MISDFLYYFLYTSSVLIYGIGVNRTVVSSEVKTKNFVHGIKMIVTVCSTSIITYLLEAVLLSKAGLSEIFPLIAVFIFSIIAILVEVIVRATAKINTADFAVSIMIVILAVNESSTLLQSFVISLVSCLSLFVFIPLLNAIKKRIELSKPTSDFNNQSLVLISIAIIILMLSCWNITWLNPGALQ